MLLTLKNVNNYVVNSYRILIQIIFSWLLLFSLNKCGGNCQVGPSKDVP